MTKGKHPISNIRQPKAKSSLQSNHPARPMTSGQKPKTLYKAIILPGQ
jgi:hypothetical protein